MHPRSPRIYTAGTHLLSLINNVLDLSKIEAGKVSLELDDFIVDALVEDVVSTVQPLIVCNGNRLVIDGGVQLGRMHSDEVKLRQVLVNLLSNAAKFTERGVVTLSVRRVRRPEGQWLHFSVRDTGIGIPQDQIDRLFTDFTQVDSSTTRKYGGTGLGLAISRRFCQQLGGDIGVVSESGQGSTFTVRVPVDCQPPAVVAEPADGGDSLRAGPALHGERVLIVDDNPATRELIARTLHGACYAVLQARDGVQALALIEQQSPALVLLDLILPNMNGFDFIADLRRRMEWRNLPVVVMTAMDISRGDRAELDGKVSAILQKGVDLRQDMLHLVQRLLRAHTA